MALYSTRRLDRLETKFDHPPAAKSLGLFRLVTIAFALVVTLSSVSCARKAAYKGKSVQGLERMLHDPDPVVQAQGAYGLGLLGDQAAPATPALIDALQSDHTLVRESAAVALGQIGPEAREAVPALIKALADREWTVRRFAAQALGRIGPDARSAVGALEKLRNDRDQLVRKAAQEALPKVKS
jgi:hypothetical protein